MNIRPYLLSAILLGAGAAAFAQDETDALRYSHLAPQGTARSMGIGGALGSIGGDFSSLSVNPAGIGVYRSSEFTFTPSLKMNNSSSTYTGTAADDNATRFTINNLGLVLSSAARGKRYEKSKWKSVSFGFGLNRIADFSNNYTYSGFNNTSSASEIFAIDANSYPMDTSNLSTLAGLGYESFLIDKFQGTEWGTVADWQGGLNQQRSVIQKGGITDMAISLGGNYMEKLMLGATLGIPVIRYKREVTYTESDASGNANNDFDNFQYRETLTTTGSGVNLKLGAIYKPADAFRIGLAVHTPTYFGLKDVQNRTVTSNTENFKRDLGYGDNPVTRVDAPENIYEYNLLTPWRGVVSATGLFGKYGFITADYEFVNYASARFNFDGNNRDYQTMLNQSIKNTYKAASILRVGAEGRIDAFSIRLGFGYYGSPYKNSAIDGSSMTFSGGVGFRSESWFLDLGFMHTQSESQETPYTLSYIPPVTVPTATIKNSFNNVALTVGFRF